MTKNIIGFVLIDAPHSALNNAGMDTGARTENTVAVKLIRRGREVFPYVSAQAWRYWWREALQQHRQWNMSPLIRESKIAFTHANPFLYPDDDVFGYMRAQKVAEGGTLTRLSPLKTSPLVSAFPQLPTDDFGVMARHEGDPVPYEHQFYSVVLKGLFSLDISSVGHFSEKEKTGYKNLDEKYTSKKEIQETITVSKATRNDTTKVWSLPLSERLNRAKDTISVLPFLSGGAKQALHHTDVTPKFIILAVLNGGNHIFMNITNGDEKKLINTNALKQVITDYKDIILSDIFIGRQEGFLDELNSDLVALQTELKDVKSINLSSPKQAVEGFTKKMGNYFE